MRSLWAAAALLLAAPLASAEPEAEAPPDPRVELVQLQLSGDLQTALERVREHLTQAPEESHRLGLDYLHAHLLSRMGHPMEAAVALAPVLVETSPLRPYSRFRLALEQEKLGHSEVAAGLFATLLREGLPDPLVAPAIRRLRRNLREKGDCRLLHGMSFGRFPSAERRQMEMAAAACALKGGDRQGAGKRYLAILEEDLNDEAAHEAADWAAVLLAPDKVEVNLHLLLGMTYHRHREFGKALYHLRRGLEPAYGRRKLTSIDEFDARYAVARSHFWREEYGAAEVAFGQLASSSRRPAHRAQTLYQRGRCLELMGDWAEAVQTFRRAYRADPNGPWSASALFATLRLEWRLGREENALKLYEVLRGLPQGRRHAARAALFLTSSDLVRGRVDRADSWLHQAVASDRSVNLETRYWRGRLKELEGDPGAALEHYLDLLVKEYHHPLSQAARRRLAAPAFVGVARERGLALARGERFEDLLRAWLLLGEDTPAGREARRALEGRLRGDRQAAPFLSLEPLPVARWPLWQASLREPEEMLLALGIWDEGAPAVARHFSISQPELAITGSHMLARAGEHRRALHIAEVLAERASTRVPPRLLAPALRQALYPPAYAEILETAARRFGVDPRLMAAILREESRFDPQAVSGASARGLMQFVLPTAQRLAMEHGLGRVTPDQLLRPEISITLGAAYLAELGERFNGDVPTMLAAYNAGEPQAVLWRSYCYSREAEEYLTKVNFRETRNYLRKVLTSYAQYRDIYGPVLRDE